MPEAPTYYNVLHNSDRGYYNISHDIPTYPRGVGFVDFPNNLNDCVQKILQHAKEHGVTKILVKSVQTDSYPDYEKPLPKDHLNLLFLVLSDNKDGIEFELDPEPRIL